MTKMKKKMPSRYAHPAPQKLAKPAGRSEAKLIRMTISMIMIVNVMLSFC